MMDDVDDLLRMANQIARNFAGYGDAEAAEAVGDHLRMFWTPSMRAALRAALSRRRDELSPLVCRALEDTDTPSA